ncbi:DUF7561 family protein [Haloparvum sedimenti]|uniref:DUF7561 family protein n=1 Tax=Haloparvum sedimenti TaxID=1678448 RepID=UPI000A985943|nr:hypothetical protein [Haloparvum sedimenti]
MASEPCEVCGTKVRIAGGIGDLWNFAFESTQGMTLELADGSEFFLCFDCVERLPGDREPRSEDVETLQKLAAEDALPGPDADSAADTDSDSTAGADADADTPTE